MEILSPAGSPEALHAAVCSGADAVYFGASSFNARMSAANFSDDILEEQIRYCHQRGVSCHGTLNTLISQRELPSALATAEKLISVNDTSAVTASVIRATVFPTFAIRNE